MSDNCNCQAHLWLTNSYLEDVLKKYLKDKQVKIIDVEIKPATTQNGNEDSFMQRIKVKFIQKKLNKKPQELTFLMKYSCESDPFVANIMSGYDVYNTEMEMYEKILPQLANILKEVDDMEQLFAKTLKVDYDKSAIIFEDLSVRNFILTDRLKGLDEQHSRLVLKKLAKFHAAAVVLNQRLNGELNKFQIFNKHTRAFGCVFEYFTEICANFAKNCSQLGPYYYEKLMKLKPHVVEYGTRAYNSNSKHFCTLCHGDLWINNIMMLYESLETKDKLLKDVLLIDFQLCNWSSVAVDLHYFFYTSLEPKLQLNMDALNKLIQYYHEVLASVLRKLKYNGFIPTLHELHVQLLEGKILALTAAIVNQPIIINDQSCDTDFRCLIDDDEISKNFRNTLYQNESLQDNLKILLPYFDQIGLLDIQ